MEGNAESSLPSCEVAAFRRYYDSLLRNVRRPVQLAELLFADGLISKETKTKLTSDEDLEQKRTLLDAIQDALVHASDRKEMFQTLLRALYEINLSQTATYMKNFVDGEYTTSIKLTRVIKVEKCVRVSYGIQKFFMMGTYAGQL